MDTFKSLTVGAKFSHSRNSAPSKLFSHGKTTKPFMGSLELLNQLDNGEESTNVKDTVFSPQPSINIDMFEGVLDHRSGGIDPGAPADDTRSNQAPKSNPLKPMSYKKMKNTWRKNDLQVVGIDIPAPITHFSDLVRPPLNVQANVIGNLFERDHKLPTPIQMQAIPSLIHERDVLACAPTGSGKTIAFLVPMFALLKEPSRETGVRALIVSPTVELAQQIEREAFFLMRGQRWRFVQHGQTTRNKDIMISSPGRIVSLLEKRLLDLSQVQYIVFDEGDRLWDTGTDFIQVVDKILLACSRKDKVISLFTATLSEKIETAARTVMRGDPIRIIVRGRQSSNTKVQQKLVFCGNELGKIVAMRNLIREGITPPVLIFVQSIERTKELYDEIRSQGLHVAFINAKMSIEERDETVLNFRLGKIWFLITTELLSRGIDFKNVGTVINFDFPLSVASYIHRVGRTGRAGKHGIAITFFTEDDRERLPPVAKVIKESGNDVEDWILEIKVDRALRRRLERTTPRRMIVSTRKRMLIADQRIERQYRRLESEEAANASQTGR
ncbi:unnamed protein product [Phytomonas sp. EM1]|nr:unnamed protein product [Phytomonas sp. EM1]|eukprot:CCW62725.1 unnamed protein product [Phytomonas sp. isolate EM1]